jgi:hypothetical protein
VFLLASFLYEEISMNYRLTYLSRLLFAAVFAVMSFSAAVSVFSQTGSKKFIELGWDIPNTSYLAAHCEEMQRSTPFDGVMLSVEGTSPDSKHFSTQEMMDTTPWEPAYLELATADLKACKWTTFTDNFIRVNFTPGKIKWEDDNGWNTFCTKTALIAKLAKQTSMKGFAVDFEPYGEPVFTYQAKSGKTFSEMRQLVRQRGQQWMKSIAAEYPDMSFLALFILDFVPSVSDGENPDAILESAHYGLLPAFFNGMLDEVPAKMKIVDGCETGYYLNGINEFSRRALMLQAVGGTAIRVIAPENRQKYISQVQVGFGFYLDMYSNPPTSNFYRGPKEGGTRLDRLEENLTAAKESADEYVWIYGEQRRWWKPSNPDTKWEHWEQSLPGTTQTIQMVKNPLEGAKKILADKQKNGTLTNLVRNPNFAEQTDWASWQDKPLGTFSQTDGTAKAVKVQWGCFLQDHSVKPAEYYFVSIDYLQQGVGQYNLRIRWKDAEGKWTLEPEDRLFAFGAALDIAGLPPLPEGWQRACGIVKVPEGAAILVIMPGIRGQETENDVVQFDNAVMYRLK